MMKMFLTLFCMTTSIALYANTNVNKISNDSLQKFYSYYTEGSYVSALKLLQSIPATPGSKTLNSSKKYYLEGLCLNKLQRFDDAVFSFRRSLIDGPIFPDIYYEYGQASYAMSDFIEAKKAFGHMVLTEDPGLTPTSLYYLGYIAQSNNDTDTAIRYYKQIKQLPPSGLTQNVTFELASILSEQLKNQQNIQKEEKAILVAENIIPEMDSAYEMDKMSELATKIKVRRKELEDEYDLNPLKLKNGKMIPEKSFDLSFRQTTSYDSNVISEPEQVTAKAVHKDTIVMKSELSAKKSFAFYRRYVVVPKWRSTLNYNSTNRTDDIKRNDTYSLNPKVEARLEHLVAGEVASLTGKVEYTSSGKRTNATSNGPIAYSGTTWNMGLGEKVKIFSVGDSTINIGYKSYQGLTRESLAKTTSLSFNQTVMLEDKRMALIYVSYDATGTPNNTTNAQATYTLRGDYIHPEIFPKWTLQGSFTLVITDTKKQKANRGIEQTLTPGLNATHSLTSWLDLALQYDYTKNISKSKTTYAYNKHVVGIELEAKF